MGKSGKPQDWKIRQYYEQEQLVQKIVEISEYREIAPTYPNGYGKRPDAINFPGDFQQFVENGAVAFHASVERWRNPLLIDDVNNLENLRQGWDLIIDIDCDHSFQLAKETAQLVINELKQHGIQNIGVKFSGNRGFHISIKKEAFPDKIEEKPLPQHYPRLPRGIIDYLRNNLKEEMKETVKKHGYAKEMKTEDGEDPYQIADIENDWGRRHLFRMPYSLHDGSWLVSLPIKPGEIQEFEKKDAEIDKIQFKTDFFKKPEKGEATNLAVQALDYLEKTEDKKEQKRKKRAEKNFERPEDAIPEKYFPPTIKNILEGLKDGRKRGLFILINFYRTVGYNWSQIESKIWEWNEQNHEPLRDVYIKTQLNWHKNRGENVPPPNYSSNGYYKDMQVYEGDPLEQKVSNPVSYAFRKAKRQNKQEETEEDEEKYECPYCGKEYKIESYYKKHVQQCFE